MKNEQNRIYNKPTYKCGICGSEHESIQQRVSCEMTCLKKQKEDEKRALEAKRKAEQATRKAEVDAALKNFSKLAEAYAKDYGSYEYDGELIPNVLWPSKLWHHFWF